MWQNNRKFIVQLARQKQKETDALNSELKSIHNELIDINLKNRDLLQTLAEYINKQSDFNKRNSEEIECIIKKIEKINDNVSQFYKNSDKNNNMFLEKTKNVSKLVGDIKQECELLSKRISTSECVLLNKIDAVQENTVSNIKNEQTKVIENIELKSQDVISSMQKENKVFREELCDHEDIISNNIGTLNNVVQEILSSILNLDDANRLIIAKLLLKEM